MISFLHIPASIWRDTPNWITALTAMIALTHYWKQPAERISIGIEINLSSSNKLIVSFRAINNSNIASSIAFVGIRNIRCQQDYSVVTSMDARKYHLIAPNEITQKYSFNSIELQKFLSYPRINDKIEVCFVTEKNRYISKKVKLVKLIKRYKKKFNAN